MPFPHLLTSRRLVALLLALCLAVPSAALAQSAGSAEQRAAEADAAWRAAVQAATRGPAEVPLLEEATLHLPRGMLYIPPAEGGRVLRASGGGGGPDLAGLVTGDDDTQWLVIVRFTREGYIRDDEARSWNADDMLSNLREGQVEANTDRVARGFPALELLGWAQPPTYDADRHRLVWSMRVRAEGQPQDRVSANYNTRALGREGYFSLNLVTDERQLAQDRPAAAALLAGLEYKPGKRYEDFQAGTDRVAEYGLAALVGVVAAKKLGLIALAGAALLKFGKIGAVVLAGGAALLAKLFRRKPNA